MRALRKLGSLAALRKELGAVPPRTVLRQDGGAAIPKLAALVAATIGALQLNLPLNLPLALHP